MNRYREARYIIMKKRIISFVLALVICVCSVFSTCAASCSNDLQADYIDELITLAGQAARSGNLELANKYEEQVQAMGVEVLSQEEIFSLTQELRGNSAETYSVPTPPDAPSVHWYRQTTTNYRNDGKYYDIIALRCVSWDDTSAWLHVDNQFVTNPNAKSFGASAAINLVQVAVGQTPWSIISTIGDFFEAINKDISNYNTLSIDKKAITCYYSADISVTFYWVSLHGEDSYCLCVRENMLSMNYSYLMRTSITQKNGKVDTINSGTITPGGEIVYKAPQYGNLGRACQAYESDIIVNYNAGALKFNLAGDTVTLPEITIPPYMDSVY